VAASDFRLDFLDLLGTSLAITTDEDPAYVEEIFGQYRTALARTKKGMDLKDPLKTAILTGFLLCDEIHKLRNREGVSPDAEEAEQLTLNLIARIDKVLEDKNSFDE
jgi:hypothetical protein